MERATIAVLLGGAMAAGLLAVAGVQTVRSGGLRREVPAQSTAPQCQSTIDGILKTRTIRFEEASAALDPVSETLLDEVAAALRPCAGSRIAITGHTDAHGDEAVNVALSLDRARTVREALVRRGIARADLRARGRGSAEPVPGLDPADPANRRIEFAVLTPARVKPTPIDVQLAK